MKGQVEKVWNNETLDGRQYKVLQINGERYSLWDDKYLDKIKEGQAVDFEFKESGEFRNITEIYDSSMNKEKETEFEDQKLRKTIRMSCLKSASRVLTGSKIPYKNRGDRAIELAKKFEKYIDDEDFDGPEGTD